MNTRNIPLLALLLLAPGCNQIHSDPSEDACPCLGTRGTLEFRPLPPGSECVAPIEVARTGRPAALGVQTCFANSGGAVTSPFDLTDATVNSTNEMLVRGLSGSCGPSCISLEWVDNTGDAELIVSRGGVEVDRVAFTVSP